MQPTVLLFDVDGTLIETGRVGRLALSRAFESRYGTSEACGFPSNGLTDRALIRRALRAMDVPDTEEEIDAVIAVYLEYLGEMVDRVEPASYYALEGVVRLLGEVHARPSVALGLGTGNIREGARLKLSRVGLFEMFAFGGFGCDHEERSVVVRMGAERGAAHLKMPLTQCRVIVIGDTPRDVEAARANGAECIGVGTGRFSPRELLDAGAHHAFATLADERAIEVLLR